MTISTTTKAISTTTKATSTTTKAMVKTISAKKVSVKKTSAKVTSAKKNIKTAIAKIDSGQEQIADATQDLIATRLETAQKLAKQAWFAGLGVYGRSYEEFKGRYTKAGEELQTRYTQITEDRQSFVKDLVSRGEKVQGLAEDVLQARRSEIQAKVEAAKTRLVSVTDVSARLQNVSDKLESMSKKLKKKAA